MNPRILLLVLLFAGPSALAVGQDEPTAEGEETAEQAVDPLTQLTEPGEHHDHLDRLVGEWDLEFRIWQSPDGEPTVSAGTAESRWILDRRFLWTIYRAQLFGEPFEAWSIEGYDNQAKEYVGTWRDTQGTYTLIYRGRCRHPPLEEGETRDESEAGAPDGTFREMKTKLTDPASGETLEIRTDLRVEEDGSGFVQESFIVLSEEESLKNLELVGTRRDG